MEYSDSQSPACANAEYKELQKRIVWSKEQEKAREERYGKEIESAMNKGRKVERSGLIKLTRGKRKGESSKKRAEPNGWGNRKNGAQGGPMGELKEK